MEKLEGQQNSSITPGVAPLKVGDTTISSSSNAIFLGVAWSHYSRQLSPITWPRLDESSKPTALPMENKTHCIERCSPLTGRQQFCIYTHLKVSESGFGRGRSQVYTFWSKCHLGKDLLHSHQTSTGWSSGMMLETTVSLEPEHWRLLSTFSRLQNMRTIPVTSVATSHIQANFQRTTLPKSTSAALLINCRNHWLTPAKRPSRWQPHSELNSTGPVVLFINIYYLHIILFAIYTVLVTQ